MTSWGMYELLEHYFRRGRPGPSRGQQALGTSHALDFKC
jgi:hypothetical protein